MRGLPSADRTAALREHTKRHSGPALLQLQTIGESLVVDVWDSEPLLPEVRSAEPERIGQHGLEIVSALATTIDIRPAPPGRRVTGHILLGTDPAGTAP